MCGYSSGPRAMVLSNHMVVAPSLGGVAPVPIHPRCSRFPASHMVAHVTVRGTTPLVLLVAPPSTPRLFLHAGTLRVFGMPSRAATSASPFIVCTSSHGIGLGCVLAYLIMGAFTLSSCWGSVPTPSLRADGPPPIPTVLTVPVSPRPTGPMTHSDKAAPLVPAIPLAASATRPPSSVEPSVIVIVTLTSAVLGALNMTRDVRALTPDLRTSRLPPIVVVTASVDTTRVWWTHADTTGAED